METSFFERYIVPASRELRQSSLFRRIPPIESGAARVLNYQGTPLLNLASNNYLGLADAPELKDAAVEAVRRYGCSSGASRLVTGNFALADALEAELALFKGQEAALVLGSGYAANLAVFVALADRHTAVFSDRLVHASIIDGIRLAGARHVRYRHNDMDHLAQCLEKERGTPRKILVTDTVFSMDGDVAPLARFAALGKAHGALVVVDEAHATGIYGGGRGMAAELGAAGDIDVHMGTFSKALGSQGGYVAGRIETIELIRNRGRSFVFSTALPPAVIGASLAALRLVAANPAPAVRLRRLAAETRDFLAGLRFEVMATTTQIIPVVLGDNEAVLHAQRQLREDGLYVAAVRPPTVPEGTARLRLSLRADLTEADMDRLRRGFVRLRGEMAP